MSTTMHKKRVLVVDDSHTMRLFYREILTSAGYDIEEAANGLEGLERAMLGQFDLMVVDVNMPKLDGYGMIRQAREDPALQPIPVLTISSESQDNDALKAYEAGANFYLVKPVDPQELTRIALLLTAGAS
jgi:two-component system, chemotaxis family, chemotaxis protein CheY